MLSLTERRVLVLIAAKPGLLRDSLLAFLRATLRIEIVAQVDEPGATLEAVRCHQPHTLVVDADLTQDALLALIRQLRAEQPSLNCVVLVNGLGQQRTFLAAGVDHALLKGFLDDRLNRAVLGEA